MAGRLPHLAIVTPICNDFEAFRALCAEIGTAAGALSMRVSAIGIDDGSSKPLTPGAEPAAANLESVEILRLICNLGDQRAIAVGLAEVAQRHAYDAVIVMDCDGENRPSDLVRLIDAHLVDRLGIIVSQREKRSEGLRFRVFYALYKGLQLPSDSAADGCTARAYAGDLEPSGSCGAALARSGGGRAHRARTPLCRQLFHEPRVAAGTRSQRDRSLQ